MSPDPLPPIIQNTVFVGNLEFTATERDLFDLLTPIGPVVQAYIARDRTGSSRGHGFVQMENEIDVLSAVTALNGKIFQGRSITVAEVRNSIAVFPWKSPTY